MFAAADNTCSTICDKIWQPQKHSYLQTPEAVVALDALGKLSIKFPTLASKFVVRSLCRFLLEPCPLLARMDPVWWSMLLFQLN